ncbi:MAG: copper resistance CopC family protein [Mycetocola sp.]
MTSSSRMAVTPFSRRRRLGLLVGVAALLMAVSSVAGAQPAQAHDYLASTSPAEEVTVESALENVSLTFTEPPLEGLETGSYISVVSAAGETVSDDDVLVEGSTLSVPVMFASPGAYTVTWQTVSSDGHPISGSYSFTWLSNGADASATPTPSTSPTDEATETPTSTSTPVPVEQTSGPSTAFFLWMTALILFFGLGVGGYLIVRARRAQSEGPVDSP